MNDFFTFSADNFGISFVSSAISIYLTWNMVTAFVALAFAPRVIRFVRRAIVSRKAASVTQ